ncbi:hypothetical protein Poli38472_004166 [Pythium oligandrum]|uniref:O-acyltransferase n=1 Tax=Pythium oligandrum TaxID=41045 RepID=A0A8K1CPK8_PYTOL|nr:hypothetical protein Poli38472_004166 [Pythium oligandrum]|eukprot:TMW66401.1 hypothetical protein Poli38472_004166 [Pythium oligandrum]
MAPPDTDVREAMSSNEVPPAKPQDQRICKRQVKQFDYIVSRLDPADHRSEVHTSQFRGLYNLAMIAGGLYAISTYLNNLVSRGGLLADWRLLKTVFFSWHLVEVFATFGCQALFSYTAMIPVYMSGTKWFSHYLLINTVHHFLQSVLFFFTSVFIIYRDWTPVHAVSAFVECLVLLMKMHSYIRTQLELARRDDKKPRQSLKNYTLYLLHPTLVYEPKYPRTDKIRWGYLTEKFIANTLAMSVFYIIVTDHVMPTLEDSGIANPALIVIQLLLPFLGCYLIIWFIIFECICNGFAEVTYLADRDFYGDWWNSTTFDEFARKWNKPVHEFLLRHVYLESLEKYKLSRHNATMLTFFVSAAVHECVFVIIFRTVKLYFFVLQMLQVVIIMYGRDLKGSRLGNYIFWIGILLGLPLQAVLYCREYHGGEPIFINIMIPIMMAGVLLVVVGSLIAIRK